MPGLNTRQKIALARMAQRPTKALRALAGRDALVGARRGGVAWRLDLDEGIDFSVFLLGGFQRQTLLACRAQLPERAVVLDIGANIGTFSLPMASTGPAGTLVIAVEPTQFAIEKFRANLTANPGLERRVQVHQVMLRATDSAVPEPRLGASWPLDARDVDPVTRDIAMGTEGSAAMTLDGFWNAHGRDRLDLIKIDVDGFECEVLDGAGAVLPRFRPVMSVELCEAALLARGATLEGLVSRIRDYGYMLVREADPRTPLPDGLDDLRASIPREGSINALALPR